MILQSCAFPFTIQSIPFFICSYTGVQETGFVDEKTGKYVHVPEMVNELVVPDLTGFK